MPWFISSLERRTGGLARHGWAASGSLVKILEPNQPRLEHVGREEGEEHDDQGEHQTHVLDAAQR